MLRVRMLRTLLTGLVVLPLAATEVTYSVYDDFTNPWAPWQRGWQFVGNLGVGDFGYSSGGSGVLQLYTVGLNGTANLYQSTIVKPDDWTFSSFDLAVRFTDYGTTGPWAHQIYIDNAHTQLALGIGAPSFVYVGGTGYVYNYPWWGSGYQDIWYNLHAWGDQNSWYLQVGGGPIANYAYPSSSHTPGTPGMIYYGDGTGSQGAYWQYDSFSYRESYTTPEATSVILTGLGLLTIGIWRKVRPRTLG